MRAPLTALIGGAIAGALGYVHAASYSGGEHGAVVVGWTVGCILLGALIGSAFGRP